MNQTISTVYADKVAKRVLHEKTHDLGLGKLQTLKRKSGYRYKLKSVHLNT
jgi:hypothetical protein